MNDTETQLHLSLLKELLNTNPYRGADRPTVRFALKGVHLLPLGDALPGDGVYVDDAGVRHHVVAVLRGSNEEQTMNCLLFAFGRNALMRAHDVLTLDRASTVMLEARLERSLPVLVNPGGKVTEIGLISQLTYGAGR